jgi:hypothetical protein
MTAQVDQGRLGQNSPTVIAGLDCLAIHPSGVFRVVTERDGPAGQNPRVTDGLRPLCPRVSRTATSLQHRAARTGISASGELGLYPPPCGEGRGGLRPPFFVRRTPMRASAMAKRRGGGGAVRSQWRHLRTSHPPRKGEGSALSARHKHALRDGRIYKLARRVSRSRACAITRGTASSFAGAIT